MRISVALVAALLSSCSSSTDELGRTGPGNDAGAPTGGSVVQPYVDAFCAVARSCCGKAAYPADPLSTCESELVRQVDVLQQAIDGTVHVDTDRLASCSTTLRAVGDSCTFQAGAADPGCSTLFTGTKAEGESCRKASECKHDTPVACIKVTSGSSTPDTGVCRTMTRGTEGAPCLTSATPQFGGVTYTSSNPDPPLAYCDSADGLHCSNEVCRRFAADGAPCTGGDCPSDSYCDTTCRKRKVQGAACTTFSECAELLDCVNGTCAPLGVASAKLCKGDYN